ncbi:hypothetical protein HN510_03150 [Candidatus Woesearchaeota archaeon]|jgi:hypothetical protein|nr:hypothetical protein [Candidatus Woesearchaeota archaeon]
MDKQYKMVGDKLQVTINNGADVFIPVGETQEMVGKYTQQTIQLIDNDKMSVLRDFLVKDRTMGEAQLAKMEKQLEPIKDIEGMDAELMVAMKESIKKGSKKFRADMMKLNQRIADIELKANLTRQIKYLKDNVKLTNSDITELNKLIKE